MSTLFPHSRRVRFTRMPCFFIFWNVPQFWDGLLRNYNFMKTYRSSEVRRGFWGTFTKVYLILVMTSFLAFRGTWCNAGGIIIYLPHFVYVPRVLFNFAVVGVQLMYLLSCIFHRPKHFFVLITENPAFILTYLVFNIFACDVYLILKLSFNIRILYTHK